MAALRRGLEGIAFLGAGLNRPECVLAHESGLIFVADWTGQGGVTVVRPDGTTHRILAQEAAGPLRPNGIALEPGGTFLLAHLGDDAGGVWRLSADGGVAPVLQQIDGHRLPPTNFVWPDGQGRIWVTVSTRMQPRHRAARADVADGFIVLIDHSGARVVADALGYANEALISPHDGRLYVNETFARRLSSFAIARDGALVDRRVAATFGPGVFPDGLAFDAEGGTWITSIISNRLIHVRPDRSWQVIVEDAETDELADVDAACAAGRFDRALLASVGLRQLRNISSLAFGGDDLRTGYLGSLNASTIPHLRLPVTGAPLPHWRVPLGPLAGFAAA